MHSTSVSTKTARVQAEVTRVQAEGRTEAAVSGSRRASVKINIEPRLVNTNVKINHADR